MRNFCLRISRRWSRIRALLRLGPLALLGHILLVALCVPWLGRLGLPRLSRWLEPRRSPSGPLDEAEIARLVCCVEGVIAAAKPLVRSDCVGRGITLYYFLRRAGVEVELAFGARTAKVELDGHCWLVRDGEPFLEPRNPREAFTEFFRFPLKREESNSRRKLGA